MLGKGSELTCGALWRDRWRGSAISHPKDQARLTHWMFEAFSALPMRSHYINHIWFFKGGPRGTLLRKLERVNIFSAELG